MTLTVEHDFELPKGFVDEQGNLHRKGVMRLATAADEILTMRDERVQGLPAYLIVLVLSRVVTKLGTVDQITPAVIERLFAQDLAYLQSVYNRLNGLEPRWLALACPSCGHEFETEVEPLGGS